MKTLKCNLIDLLDQKFLCKKDVFEELNRVRKTYNNNIISIIDNIISNVMPKEKDQDPADDNNNNPADDFPSNTGDSEGQDPNGATFSDKNTDRDFQAIQ